MPKSPKRKSFPTVMQLVPNMHGGGAEQATLEIARALKRRGARHYVASYQGELIQDLYAAKADIFLIAVGRKSPSKIWRNARRLARLAQTHKIDLLHARSRAPAWVAWLVHRWTGKPYLCTCHGRPPQNWWKRLYALPMVQGSAVIANSRWTAAGWQRAYKLPPGRIRVIARGVDASVFAPQRQKAGAIAELRRYWRVLPQEQVLLLPARVTADKGHGFMLDVLHRFLPQTPLRLVCVGDLQAHPRLVRALEAQAQRLAIFDKLVFAGPSRDMPLTYAASDIVAVPSLAPEPFGRPVIEAQAAGRVVLAADHGGISETIADGTGFRLPPGKLAAWEKGLRQVLGLRAAERARLVRRARAHVIQHYPLSRMSQETLKIYQECMANKS